MSARRRTVAFVLVGLLVSLVLAAVVSTVASGAPDGLEAAATRGCTVDADGAVTGGTCMARGARDHELGTGPLADYGVRGVGDARLSTGLAGAVGVLLTFAVAGGLFWLARRRPDPAAAPPAADRAPAPPATPLPAVDRTAPPPAADRATPPPAADRTAAQR